MGGTIPAMACASPLRVFGGTYVQVIAQPLETRP
jgi:hypothetical protein